jgi:hypothetical protein
MTRWATSNLVQAVAPIEWYMTIHYGMGGARHVSATFYVAQQIITSNSISFPSSPSVEVALASNASMESVST